MFDPLKQRAVGPAPPLAEKSDNSPEDLAREMEKQVNHLIEASAEAALQRDAVQALERAKEAVGRCPSCMHPARAAHVVKTCYAVDTGQEGAAAVQAPRVKQHSGSDQHGLDVLCVLQPRERGA